jgi:hypothetical protein
MAARHTRRKSVNFLSFRQNPDIPDRNNSSIMQKSAKIMQLIYARLYNHVRKIFALLAAILILPALIPAVHGQNQGGNGQGGNGQGGNRWTTPEANTGIVLIPFVGAVLVFSAFRLLRGKAAQKKG